MFFDTTDLKNKEIYLSLYKTSDENIEKGYVPAYYFKIVRSVDDIEVGQCDLRIGHNNNTKYGGNIGYEIHKFFRGNYYASKACKLLSLLAKKHKMNEVIITCSPDNIASQKTCEYCGAELVGIIDVPTWHDMYKNGQKKTCQYRVRL
ncbi:GNAT family N-acetyltransferase [Sedimentibacter sp. zth1]|uniref:GNAT family N-acetyltransferase n=1 Tax=Sedimentibacter sp. zth1 TaxID=2816908 RepID=UPI001A927601|nr:GNAT family N-acetyltransferase [Sedimentibacter sp. zth1]QSX05687.1 GNAT family N-acetyltransferase [Sedimentibacter sp. zth1]